MTHLRITGGRALTGSTPVQGSKNVFLHLAAASLLSDRPVQLRNVPRITDTEVVAGIISNVGAQVSLAGAAMNVHADDIANGVISSDLGGSIRPTACFGAALLARTGRAVFPTPGGDSFAVRHIDLHIAAMRAAGAEVRAVNGIVMARAPGLRAFDFDCSTEGGFGPSLGATVSALLLASSVAGESRLTAPSEEPEVVATVALLRQMGAEIEEDGDGALLVHGCERFAHAAAYVPPDRMAAGTLLIAGAITGGRTKVHGLTLDDLPRGFVEILVDAGLKLSQDGDTVRGECSGLAPVTFETGVHPGCPTDLQPQLVALLTQAPGTSYVAERVYTYRATHVPGLAALGADVTARGQELTITGPSRLRGTTVQGEDIRAATALLLAALAAEGTTMLYGVEHLRRGYEDLAGALRAVGADITEEEQ